MRAAPLRPCSFFVWFLGRGGDCFAASGGLSSGGERVFELLPEERRFDEAAFSVDDNLDAVVLAAAELRSVLDEAAQSHLLAVGVGVGDADRPCEAGEPDEARVVRVSGEHAA